MFSVIFEVYPKEQRFEEYLALAKHLKPILEKIDGFVDNESFESKRRPGWILSHSTWRDEKSVHLRPLQTLTFVNERSMPQIPDNNRHATCRQVICRRCFPTFRSGLNSSA